jgi:hypothetical protein
MTAQPQEPQPTGIEIVKPTNLPEDIVIGDSSYADMPYIILEDLAAKGDQKAAVELLRRKDEQAPSPL